jgi:hypothetical protein
MLRLRINASCAGSGPREAMVEVLGRVGAEGGRRILQHRARMQQPLVERQRVDEGLERGAGRALGQHAVDLSRDGVVAEVGRADHRAHLHGRCIEQQSARVGHAHVGVRAQVLGHHALQRGLHAQVDGGAHLLHAALLREQHVGGVRRQKRQAAARLRGERELRVGGVLPGGGIALGPQRPQAFARGLQLGVAAALGDALDGVLRNHRERQRLGQAEPGGVLAKVDEARGLYAFDVAAIGRGVEVGLEDVVLAEARLEPQGREDLRDLAGGRAAVDAVHAARELHGERGAALAALAAGDAPCAARERGGVDAGMRVEAAVFVEQHGVDQRGRDACERHPEAVLLVAREREAHELAALGVDGARAADGVAQCRVGPEAQQGEQRGDEDKDDERLARAGLAPSPSPARGRGLG